MHKPNCLPQPAEFALDGEAHACRLTLRPIRPDDGARLAELYATMSPGARRQRFHHATRGPSALALLTMCCVDFEHDSAWVVSRLEGDDCKGDETLVAEARWHLDDDNPAGDSAEFAIAVADGMRQLGLGRRLMHTLEQDAAAHGVRCLHGDVLSGNAAMLALMQRCDYELDGNERASGDTVRVEHRLAPPANAASAWAGLRQAWWRLTGRLGTITATGSTTVPR